MRNADLQSCVQLYYTSLRLCARIFFFQKGNQSGSTALSMCSMFMSGKDRVEFDPEATVLRNDSLTSVQLFTTNAPTKSYMLTIPIGDFSTTGVDPRYSDSQNRWVSYPFPRGQKTYVEFETSSRYFARLVVLTLDVHFAPRR